MVTALLIAAPFLIAYEIRPTDVSTFHADDQTERVVTVAVVDGLFLLIMIIVAWAVHRAGWSGSPQPGPSSQSRRRRSTWSWW